MPVVTEVMDPRCVEVVERYADMIQIGARNMQNFVLLTEVGRTHKPVLLKRGMSATIDDLLMSAEYILSQGNSQVVLCERGVKGFDNVDAQPVRRGRRAGRARAVALADHRRSQPRHGPARFDSAPVPWPAWRPAPTACTSKFTTARRRPSPTGRRPCCREQYAEVAAQIRKLARAVWARQISSAAGCSVPVKPNRLTADSRTTMRKKFIAGNWKMNLDRARTAWRWPRRSPRRSARVGDVEVAVCPPSVYLDAVGQAIAGSTVGLGARTCYHEAKGAFTGEISPAMLVDVGCKYVILGHSERRHDL